jgi:hypothetical protein
VDKAKTQTRKLLTTRNQNHSDPEHQGEQAAQKHDAKRRFFLLNSSKIHTIDLGHFPSSII